MHADMRTEPPPSITAHQTHLVLLLLNARSLVLLLTENSWGTDLSFSFVYVRALEPTGAAAVSGQVRVGDQLCEATPIVAATAKGTTDKDDDNNKPATVTAPAVNLIGAPFDFVMQTFANLDKSVKELDLVFFRGTKDELKGICTGQLASPEPETITVTVIQNKGAPDETVRTLTAPSGVNLRELLVQNKINVYQSITRWTNCKGKQLCGTCIVNVKEGAIRTNRKSMDEASTLRENPDSYRLSCITFAYGDCTVETFPPITAAQWTR